MYETGIPTSIDILDLFHIESSTLSEAIKQKFKHYLVKEDSMLWAPGTKLYERVDPLLERGIIATARMLLVKDETISFNRVSEILISEFCTKKKDEEDIKSLSKIFKALRTESNEVFDMFWHVSHLHKDISDERYIKHFNLMHSCAGPPTYALLYDHLIEFSNIISSLDDNYVMPVLIKNNRIYVDM
jgi:hypothetical protein